VYDQSTSPGPVDDAGKSCGSVRESVPASGSAAEMLGNSLECCSARSCFFRASSELSKWKTWCLPGGGLKA
jgi:hypothetical protein